MRQRFAVAAIAIGALALSTAWAVTTFNGNTAPSGAHYAQGEGEPTCSVSGLSVSCTGTRIGGVGNTDATLVLSVSYSGVVQCRNRGGQIVEVKTQTTSTTSSNNLTQVKNGQLTVLPVSSSTTQQALESQATCPNGNWTRELQSASVSSFRYTLTFEGFGQPVIAIPS
jgi:hypothetical protein